MNRQPGEARQIWFFSRARTTGPITTAAFTTRAADSLQNQFSFGMGFALLSFDVTISTILFLLSVSTWKGRADTAREA